GPTARRDSDRLERAVFFSRMGNHDSVLFNVLETIATFECSRATRHAAHGRASGRMTRSQSQDLEIEYRKDGNARIHVTPASVAGEMFSRRGAATGKRQTKCGGCIRSEEHTSGLQSR